MEEGAHTIYTALPYEALIDAQQQHKRRLAAQITAHLSAVRGSSAPSLSHTPPSACSSMEVPEQFPVFFSVPSGADAEQLRRIRTYFQIRRRSGGGECGSVTHLGDNVHCVRFREREAQQRVLQTCEHVLEFAGGSLVLTVRDRIEPPGSSPIAASDHGPTSSQQKQPVPASSLPPSGEECDLQPDTYLLRYLKECPQAWNELETELASMDCTAQLFPEEGRLTVRRSAQPGAGAESRSLKAQVDKLLQGYLCHFEFDPLKVKALLRSRQAADDVREYPDIRMVVVVGKHSQVNARLMDIEEVTVQGRSGEKQTSIRRLGEAKLRLLWREMEEGLGKRFPGVQVTRRDAGQVALEGSLKDVVEAGEWISGKENLVVERRVSNMSTHLLAFVRKAYGAPGALQDFLGVGDEVEIELRDTELCFLSLSPDKLDDQANKMQEKFKELKIDLPNSSAVPTELREKLKSKTSEMNQGQLRAQAVFYADSTVCLLGHTKEVAELNETVNQYILDQSSIEGKVSLRFPELVQLLPELLQLHSFDLSGVTLHPLTSASVPMVALEGPSSKVTEVRNRLGPFLSSLVQRIVSFNLPGALRYFESPSGRENISRVALSQKCLIKLQVQPHMTLNLESGAGLSDGGTIVASYNMCDGLQVVVCQGDITKVVADALVNAANADLEHSGGVAAALSSAGGPEVQRESKTLAKQIGKVHTGDVVVTTGGNLPCKKLLHAVGPVFGKVGGRERSLLEKTVQSALNMAERMELRSVAMPCISSGVFGVPVNVCSEAIVTAVREFCTQGGRSLRTVILIDNRAEVVRALQEACDRLFPGRSTGNSPPRDVSFQTDAAGGDRTRGATAGAPGDNVHVEVVQGTIETQQVDVLVSPMVGHDPLSTRIGNILLNVVGPQLVTKFSQNAGGATIPGAIVLLEGLSAPGCKDVIFLHLLPWDNNQNGTAVQVLRQGIRKVLASCEDKGFHSVALPVLGTGVLLRFPHSVASRTLLEEVLVFQQSRASRSAFLVRVVIHPGDKESSKAFQSAQETVHVRGFRNGSNPDQASFYRKVSGTNDEVTAMVGGVKLQMVLGDIVTGGTDVIVNTTDFKTHSGVSRAILSAAGQQVQAQLAQVGIPADHMCTTGPGMLGCREIIHASFRSDPQWIQKNCKKILKQCESKGYSSVSFPAINTGVAGLDSGRACKAMLDGMASAVRDLKLTSLSLIRIVVLQQPVFQVFRSELASRFGKPAPSRPSLKEKAKQIFKKILEKSSRASSSSAQQGKPISSQPQPAVLSVICCGPDIMDAIKTDLEGHLHKQLIEREVKMQDFASLDDMELEAVLTKVRGFGISLESRRRQSSESSRSGVPTRAGARDRSAAAEEMYVLRGLKEDVLSTTELINRAIQEALSKDRQDEKEAMTAYHVQWLIQDAEEEWQELSLHENFLLEDAFLNKRASAEVTARDATALRVNLSALEAVNQQTGQRFKVKRSETGTTLELPTNWEPMNEDVFKKVELNPTSHEYQVVAQGFLKTAKYTIRKIERVQNLYLWQAFSVCRQRIFSKNGRDEQQLGERSLYHGTSAESCDCIEKDRFDRNYAGRHATRFGKGVYFAVNAEYSAKNFCPRDPSGLGRLYVARVLTGRYTVGNPKLNAPPPRGTDPTDCFDSLVDNQQTPTMFVVFHDDQAYPEYLITFS